MKRSIKAGIIAAASAFALSSPAVAAPPAGSPYATDPQNSHVFDETSQAIGQRGVALSVGHAFDRNSNGPGWPDQDRELLGPREASVHQIATEQQIVLHEQGQDDDWVLTPLTLVDSDSPGKSEF